MTVTLCTAPIAAGEGDGDAAVLAAALAAGLAAVGEATAAGDAFATGDTPSETVGIGVVFAVVAGALLSD